MSNGTVPPGKYDEFLSSEMVEVRARGKERYKQFLMPLIKRLREAWNLDPLSANAVVFSYLRRRHPELLPPRCSSMKALPLLGQFDEFLSAEVEAERQAGKKPAMITLIKKLKEARNLNLRESKEVVGDYAARQCPELLGAGQGAQKWTGWFMLFMAAFQTALLFVEASRSALSLSLPIIFWILAGTTLTEAYWVKGDVRKYRIVWGVTGVLYLCLAVWMFTSSDPFDRRFGWFWIAIAIGLVALAFRRKWQ